jgi:NADPH:quinone reductase-like Zn-dependent oxidoreductase
MGSAADFSAMLAAVNTHKIIPIVDSTYSLTDLELALRYMDAGGQFGKIVITH